MNRRRILVVAAAGLCAAVWTYACGDGATEPPTPPPDPPRPATVAVAPATVRLTALGATEQLTAEVRDQNGNVMAGAAVSWASSTAAVATVSASGLVTAVANGTATITATAGSASGTATVEVTVENPDRAALVALYEAVGGRSWTRRDNWLTDAPLAEWHGIETDRVGRVVSLDLGENGLAGRIPVEIGDLAALERFVLTDNQLTGPIPSEIGGLSNLTQLLLAGNSLEGAIPSEVGNLAKLESLELARNQMTGQIPAELGDLSNLERLWLGSNFMKGPLPPELGNLAGLGDLRLSNMGLTGPIPPELGNLSRASAFGPLPKCLDRAGTDRTRQSVTPLGGAAYRQPADRRAPRVLDAADRAGTPDFRPKRRALRSRQRRVRGVDAGIGRPGRPVLQPGRPGGARGALWGRGWGRVDELGRLARGPRGRSLGMGSPPTAWAG